MLKERFTCSRLTCGALRNTETFSKVESNYSRVAGALGRTQTSRSIRSMP
jgi:hypothetical protein